MANIEKKDNKSNRGREADNPGQIPKAGWRDIGLRVKDQISEDNLNLISAGVAFYAFLALFPTIGATIIIYGMVVDPSTVQQQLQVLTGILPPQARQLIGQQLSNIAGQSQAALGWGGAFSLLLALWSANKGMKGLFAGIGIAYDEEDHRGFFKLNVITLLFTIGAIFLVIISALLIVAFPPIISSLSLPAGTEIVAQIGRWLFLFLLILVSLSLIYAYGADRATPKIRWITLGATIAAVLWLMGSWGFSFYVANFGNYNATYGSVAAVVIVLLWLLLTSYSILLGAEINSEMEGQTRKDSTTGQPRPMGERGATHADHLGRIP